MYTKCLEGICMRVASPLSARAPPDDRGPPLIVCLIVWFVVAAAIYVVHAIFEAIFEATVDVIVELIVF